MLLLRVEGDYIKQDSNSHYNVSLPGHACHRR